MQHFAECFYFEMFAILLLYFVLGSKFNFLQGYDAHFETVIVYCILAGQAV